MAGEETPPRPDGGDDDEWSIDTADYELPPGGAAFFEELSSVLDESRVRCVLLFGSVTTGEVRPMSDVDCLIVLSGDASSEYVTSVQAACTRLASRHLEDPDATPNPLERFVDRSTGMFRSGFVTTERAVRTGQFPSVFNTSPLATVLAPWRTVLYSVFDSADTVAGNPIEPDWATVGHPLDHQVGELARNWLMTTLLASVQVPYRLVSRRAVLYSLEAFKWTAYNCAFHHRGRRPDSLEHALAVVPVGSWYTDRFRWARASNAASLALLLVTPLVIAVVHARTLVSVLRS